MAYVINTVDDVEALAAEKFGEGGEVQKPSDATVWADANGIEPEAFQEATSGLGGNVLTEISKVTGIMPGDANTVELVHIVMSAIIQCMIVGHAIGVRHAMENLGEIPVLPDEHRH